MSGPWTLQRSERNSNLSILVTPIKQVQGPAQGSQAEHHRELIPLLYCASLYLRGLSKCFTSSQTIAGMHGEIVASSLQTAQVTHEYKKCQNQVNPISTYIPLFPTDLSNTDKTVAFPDTQVGDNTSASLAHASNRHSRNPNASNSTHVSHAENLPSFYTCPGSLQGPYLNPCLDLGAARGIEDPVFNACDIPKDIIDKISRWEYLFFAGLWDVVCVFVRVRSLVYSWRMFLWDLWECSCERGYPPWSPWQTRWNEASSFNRCTWRVSRPGIQCAVGCL